MSNKYFKTTMLNSDELFFKAKMDAAISVQKHSAQSADRKKEKALNRGVEVACGCARAFNSHNHTYFSVLDGISSPADMVAATARNGWQGFGISDHGSMGGNLKAGAAAKSWKSARLHSGEILNFEEISFQPGKEHPLAALFTTRTLVSNAGRYSAQQQRAIVGAVSFSSDGVIEITVAQDSKDDFHLVVIDGSVLTNKVPLDSLSGRYGFIESGARAAFDLDLRSALQGIKLKQTKITYNPRRPQDAMILQDEDIQSIMPFTVVSGVELYISWERDKHKRYNHITCYATGKTGHEALVRLTSIGSISSRRYVGERGFYRPRVFVEDLALAVKEAAGELVVTTGCPISITSEALRRGDIAAAEEFFQWGVDNLGSENFFAELHLCDVSLDYNRNHQKADGKFYSAVFGAPVSRMRLTSKDDAKKHAEGFLEDLRALALGAADRAAKFGESVSLAERVYDSDVFKSKDEETAQMVFDHVTTGKTRPFEEYGVRVELSDRERQHAGVLFNKAVSRLKSALDAIVAADAQEPSSKKAKKPTQIVDEDTASLISIIIGCLNRQELPHGAKLISAFSALIIAKLIEAENIQSLNPAKTLESVLSGLSHIAGGKYSESLKTVANDRALFLDALDDKDVVTLLDEAAVSIITALQSMDLSLLWSCGPEDELEKEFKRSKEGNWMIGVNRHLVQIAKKYDVPLLVASDAHMSSIELKPVQDALLKNGERRRWHFSRPYAVPSAYIPSFCENVGRDNSSEIDCDIPSSQNIVSEMMQAEALSMTDIIEGFGSGSLLLDRAKCVSSFKWDPAPPKISYKKHPLYRDAMDLLESGDLRAFLPAVGSGAQFEFSDKSINIATALIVMLFFRAVDSGEVPNTEEYLQRLFSELYLQQELPPQQLADFFLVLQYSLSRFRDAGISVGPGRGSSGGMLTAFISGITFADPIKHKFLESRWMNRGRKEKGDSDADIDIDVDDRTLAGHIFAQVAKEAVEDDIETTPLTPLEAILLPELFYSSPSVSHKEVDDLMAASRTEKSEGEDIFSTTSLVTDEDAPIVFGTPIVRVGTYQSLKAKAAVKEAIRMLDSTTFAELPSFGVPTGEWLANNREAIRGLSEEERNARYEEEMFGNLSARDRTDRRRVRLAERISEEMKIGSGMARLYSGPQMELDYFMGSVYGICPDNWDHSFPPPAGSLMAAQYFDKNPSVKEMALRFLNIYKNVSVHAGGFCIGRELMSRIPLRVDKHGFVSQLEMKDIEKVRVLKFDILGLNTLTLIKESLRMWVEEQSDESALAMFPKDVWDSVKNGGSTDFLWKYLPLSTPQAVEMMCKNRSTVFQIDTKVYGKELERLSPSAISDVVRRIYPDQQSPKNYGLVDILSAFLAVFRPGPMKSHSHSIYIDRLLGQEYEVAYKWMGPFVADTFGVIVYQEQVMAMTAAGLGIDIADPEVDEIRRAMGKKDAAALKKMRAQERFEAGLALQGVDKESAAGIWGMIAPFAEYGFNLPHSYHYAIISAITLWSKTHNFKNWFKTTMANSKPEEVARFLGEVSNPRAVCVLRSEEYHWSYVGNQFYQGITNISGIQEKDVVKLSKAKAAAIQLGLKRLAISKEADLNLKLVHPIEFFYSLGPVSKSFIEKLAKSGAFRIFGDRTRIAKAYAATALAIKEQAKHARKSTKTAHNKDLKRTFDKDSLLDDLLQDQSPGPSNEPAPDIDYLGMAFDVYDGIPANEIKEMLNKEDREAVSLLESYGYAVGWAVGQQLGRYRPVDGILTPESALDMVSINKTKGLGVRWYVFAMHEQAVRENLPYDFATLGELLKFTKADGSKIRKKDEYYIPAFVSGVFAGKNYRTGQSEYRITLIADGLSLNAKLDKGLAPDEIESIAKLLKDEKMQSMLLFSIVPNMFTDRQSGRDVAYFTITKVTRPKTSARDMSEPDAGGKNDE